MSSRLEQLRKMTVVVADSGDFEAIREFRPTDATTNPSLLLQALALPHCQKMLNEAIAAAAGHSEHLYTAFAARMACQLLQTVPGYVSIEVDARASFDIRASILCARDLIAQVEQLGGDRQRVLIKLAATWEGIKAAEVLEREGIACNLTLLFSFAQAQACADANVTLISPFVGRILDWHQAREPERTFSGEDDPGVLSVQQIYQHYKRHGYRTIVMGASFRNSDEIAALAGCDRLTISPKLLAELEQDQRPLPQKLQPLTEHQAAPHPMSEAGFRLALNADAMATEKLAEGIRRFIADLEQLESQLAERQAA